MLKLLLSEEMSIESTVIAMTSEKTLKALKVKTVNTELTSDLLKLESKRMRTLISVLKKISIVKISPMDK